jgi:hypothetical protein
MLIYLHGTNGSGKTTLARAVLRAAGGAGVAVGWPQAPGCHYTPAAGPYRPRVALLGRYSNACGGMDTVRDFATGIDIARHLLKERYNVLIEGLATPGIETCTKLHIAARGHALFVTLDTPLEQCMMNVLKRRKAAGNVKPFNPANLQKKWHGVQRWGPRLHAAGLRTATWQYGVALPRIVAALIMEDTLQ